MNKARLLWCVLLCLAWPVAAQNVELAGVLGGKALLIIDDAPPRAVAVGNSYKGVKVVSAQADSAQVEAGAHSYTIRLGEAPANIGGSAAGSAPSATTRVVLSASTGGHFLTSAQVNGSSLRAVIDTGASVVALSVGMADSIGLAYRNGMPAHVSTANGVVPAWRIKLNSVRVGDVTLYGVDAVVSTGEMPYVLLGNSFLSRFQMTRTNDQMVLEKRY